MKLPSYYHYSVENYNLWDCARCLSTSGYHFCRDDLHPNGVCLPEVADGYHVPCGSRPDLNDELILTCGKKYY